MRRAIAKLSLLLAVLPAMASCAGVNETNPDARAALVNEYYSQVLEDRVRITPRRLRAALGDSVIIEPIGWTVSGEPFSNVVSGDWTAETRLIEADPPGWFSPRHRAGRIPVRVVTIRSTDLPEYFDFIESPRTGFASAANDVIFLDARRGASPEELEESIYHESMHILDRDNFGVLAHSDLEARAMVHSLARAGLVARNLERLVRARGGSDAYGEAARRILAALELVSGARVDGNAVPEGEAGSRLATAAVEGARILERLAGISFRIGPPSAADPP